MRSAANSRAARSAGFSLAAAATSSRFGTSNVSPASGAQPSNFVSSSRSASSPSAATRAQMSATTARSFANWDRSSLLRDIGDSSHEPTSKRLTLMRPLAQPPDRRLHGLGSRLDAPPVHPPPPPLHPLAPPTPPP